MKKKNDKQQPKQTSMALLKIQHYFPKVLYVEDATEAINFTIEAMDVSAAKSTQSECVIARACKRQGLCEDALISIGTAYLISGHTATKYLVPPTVGREICSFDRHHDFAVGRNYRLMRIPPCARRENQEHGHKRTNTGKGTKRNHRTVRVRTFKDV